MSLPAGSGLGELGPGRGVAGLAHLIFGAKEHPAGLAEEAHSDQCTMEEGQPGSGRGQKSGCSEHVGRDQCSENKSDPRGHALGGCGWVDSC